MPLGGQDGGQSAQDAVLRKYRLVERAIAGCSAGRILSLTHVMNRRISFPLVKRFTVTHDGSNFEGQPFEPGRGGE